MVINVMDDNQLREAINKGTQWLFDYGCPDTLFNICEAQGKSRTGCWCKSKLDFIKEKKGDSK